MYHRQRKSMHLAPNTQKRQIHVKIVKKNPNKNPHKSNENPNKKGELEKLWINIIRGSHVVLNGMTIDFVASKVVEGEIEIKIEETHFESKIKFWESTLHMYVLGGDLSLNVSKQYMTKYRNQV